MSHLCDCFVVSTLMTKVSKESSKHIFTVAVHSGVGEMLRMVLPHVHETQDDGATVRLW